MLAENYMLLNAPRTKESLVYGKVFVDFNATLRGPVDALVMRGNMNLLGNTDVTYVLMDSPLTVQDRLGDLVTLLLSVIRPPYRKKKLLSCHLADSI